MIFTGVDYYFAENIYLGLEIGIGMSNDKDKSGEWSQTVGQTTTTVTTFKHMLIHILEICFHR